MNFQVNEGLKIKRNSKFERIASSLRPKIYEEIILPKRIIEVAENTNCIHGYTTKFRDEIENLQSIVLGKGEDIIIDFCNHYVGYLSLDIEPVGSPPDAPLHFKVTFGEMPVEMGDSFDTYNGWISSSWLQEESAHVDVLPQTIEMSRRYSFRYVKIHVLDTSVKYKIRIKAIRLKAVTSANKANYEPLDVVDERIKKLDSIGAKTLEDCMQDIFEDGPKRDRRLWLGDLRLQALTNYYTFKNNDLVKRNLYQFAAVPSENGQVAANLFIKPELIPDDTFLFDYSLFFACTLYDYFEYTSDIETLKDLWPTAYRQVELAIKRLDESGIVLDDDTWWSFIDWNEDLNKQAPSQAILIYSIKRLIKLATILNKNEAHNYLGKMLTFIQQATINHLYDSDEGFFISGKSKQISWASQVWGVLAEILPKEENRNLLKRLLKKNPSVGLNTPYMHHHLVEALFNNRLNEEAAEWMHMYWGGMIENGADTFWELYNPSDLTFSPYGNHLINSYCHAWSCTPTYLIRKYLVVE